MTGRPLRSRSYLSFNFAIAKVGVAIRLAKDGKTMGDIWFQLSPRMVSTFHHIFPLLTKSIPVKEDYQAS